MGFAQTQSKLPPQLESILSDVRSAIQVKLYYPALLVALTIPEICSALELDDNDHVKCKHYKAFVDKYTTPSSLGLSGQDCYYLRGGVVHRANAAGHEHFGTSHVIFSVPESPTKMHGFSSEIFGKTAAMFDLVQFCEVMILAAQMWFQDHGSEPKVIQNIPRLLSLRPDGVTPFVSGGPVVASGAQGSEPASMFIFRK